MLDSGPLMPLHRKRRKARPLKLGLLAVLFVALCALAVQINHIAPKEHRPDTATNSATVDKPQTEAPGASNEAGTERATSFLTLFGQSATNPSRLVPISLEVPRDGELRDSVDAIIRALQMPLANPAVLPTIPKGTRILAVFQKDGDLYVDMSREFVLHHPGGSLECCMTVYSVVNSLTRLPGVQRVKFLVGGQEETDFKGHLDFSPFYSFNGRIVAGEESDAATASTTATQASQY